MELEWLKKSLSCSDARELRKLVDPGHPELSVSHNVRCWVCPDPCCITGPRRCGHRHYGSWPGLTLSTWWRSLICSPEMSSAGSSRTALTRSSVSMPWRWRWQGIANQRSSAPTRAANSPLATSRQGCRQRRSRSAGQEGNAATTTSWSNGCGTQSNTRRCICTPTAMVGTLRLTWRDSSGDTAM